MGKHRASDLRFCSRRMCRSGRHSKWGRGIVQYARRRQRRMVKRLIQKGDYDIPNRFEVPYTD